MKLALRSAVLFACAGALAACDSTPDAAPTYPNPLQYLEVPECDPSLHVEPLGAGLIITNPAALKGLTMEKVMSQLQSEIGGSSALVLAQRLFEGSNNDSAAVFSDAYHCDSADNPAHANGPAAFCPRTEGALAASQGLLTPGNKDYFAPVAVVNRFDLTPLTANTCGEARIVYAKQSGLTDPQDRVFVIVEASVPNPAPGDLNGCRAVAKFWHKLQAEANPEKVGEELRSFFFEPASNGMPVISSQNLGFGLSSGAGYYGGGGQIRISQHMDEHWELRQVVASSSIGGFATFDPVPVGNNPLPSRFGDPGGAPPDYNQQEFAYRFASTVESLAAPDLVHIRSTYDPLDLSGESALGGDALNDYPARAAQNAFLQQAIQDQLADMTLDCPADDPMTPDAIVRRATMDSCAGCHAPSQFLGKDRKIGCGLTWPDSLGEVHISESGELSPALKEVFLPHRAEVLERYLQACEPPEDSLNSAGDGASTKKLTRDRTLGGGSNTH